MARFNNDGGPAFPRPASEDRTHGDLPDGNSMVAGHEGMSLRDYFAAHCAAALITASAHASGPESQFSLLSQLGETAYAYADKLIRARQ